MSAQSPIRRLYIYGAGGHGREIAWLAQELLPGASMEFVVDAAYHPGGPAGGLPVRVVDDVVGGPDAAFVTAVGDGALRHRAVAALAARGLRAVALVHPRAEVAPGATVGEGAVVCAGSVISADVHVGAHAVVNLGCTISHDVRIGAFATLSPGVHIAGNVEVGEDALIGIGASIANGAPGLPLVIGESATVGAGATVIRDVAPGAVVVGVPARPIHEGGAA